MSRASGIGIPDALTAQLVTNEEGVGSDIHAGAVGRVQAATQAEVFGAARGEQSDRGQDEFASRRSGFDRRGTLGLSSDWPFEAARAGRRRFG
jgi:hypothetical protein